MMCIAMHLLLPTRIRPRCRIAEHERCAALQYYLSLNDVEREESY